MHGHREEIRAMEAARLQELVFLSLHREGYSGFGAQREHSFFERSCRSSKRGLHTAAAFCTLRLFRIAVTEARGWMWSLGASSHTNTQSELWHCMLPPLGWQKACAFTGATNTAHLFLT